TTVERGAKPPFELLRRVPQRHGDEGAWSVRGLHAAAEGRHVAAEPADAGRALLERAAHGRPLLGEGPAELAVTLGALDHDHEARGPSLEALDRREHGVRGAVAERLGRGPYAVR